MTDVSDRVARVEERVSHMPSTKDLAGAKEHADGKVNMLRNELYEQIAKEVDTLATMMTERLGHMRAALLSDMAVERAEFKKEILEEFQKHMGEITEAQDRLWRRIGIVASALPIVIILLLWVSGAMSTNEAASAVAGSV